MYSLAKSSHTFRGYFSTAIVDHPADLEQKDFSVCTLKKAFFHLVLRVCGKGEGLHSLTVQAYSFLVS